MYQPPAFVVDEAAATALIGAYPLAQLVVASPDGLQATPVPLVRRGDALVGHLARPNSLSRLAGPALAVFSGPSAYVSPGWYPSKREHGKVVPTWNYETVHVQGTLVVHDDAGWTLDVVRFLTDTFEAASPTPWSVDDAPPEYIASMLRAIVGIELVDLRVDAKRKLSQNRDDADRAGVLAALAAGNPGQQAVADAMGSPVVTDSDA